MEVEIEMVRVDVAVLPEVRLTVGGFRANEGPAGLMVAVRFTAPTRLFRLVIVIDTGAVEVVPPCRVTAVMFAEMVKSGPTRRVMLTACMSVPVVPVTLTL